MTDSRDWPPGQQATPVGILTKFAHKARVKRIAPQCTAARMWTALKPHLTKKESDDLRDGWTHAIEDGCDPSALDAAFHRVRARMEKDLE